MRSVHEPKTTSAMRRSERMAITALAPSSRRIGTAVATATTPATPAARSTTGQNERVWWRTTPGAAASREPFRNGSMVNSAAVYAPTPTKAMWPNERMPELPENVWSATTKITLMKKCVTFVCSDSPLCQPQ